MNNTFRLYGIIFIIVLVVLALLQLNKTAVVDWRKNFDIRKKTPFGLFVFSEEAGKMLSGNLTRTTLSPYQFYKNKKKTPHNILLIQTEVDDESLNKILTNVAEGSDLFLISDLKLGNISDTLRFTQFSDNLSDRSILKLTDRKFRADSLLLDKLPGGRDFSIIPENTEILGINNKRGYSNGANFIKISYGEGHVYLHSEPLMLTNYYLLKPGNEKYVETVFSYLPNRETVWFTGENEENAVSASPLRFILSKPALRYAWWMLLGGLLLFVVFNVKRRQRIVPVIEPLKNKSVEFVKSIGNLYLQEGDFHDMMAKKAQYFLNRVRLDLLIDTKDLDAHFIKALHLKTGKKPEMITEAVVLLKKSLDPYASVMKEDLMRMNRLLDELLKQ